MKGRGRLVIACTQTNIFFFFDECALLRGKKSAEIINCNENYIKIIAEKQE